MNSFGADARALTVAELLAPEVDSYIRDLSAAQATKTHWIWSLLSGVSVWSALQKLWNLCPNRKGAPLGAATQTAGKTAATPAAAFQPFAPPPQSRSAAPFTDFRQGPGQLRSR